jgi:opacity protein-like surface antigen
MEVSANGQDAADPRATASGWTYGFTVGGGVEVAVADNVTAKVEYLYTDFFDTLGASPIDSSGGGTATFDFTANHLLKFGLNAHF